MALAYFVMVIANPTIDGKDGLDVIALQLAFFKDSGIKIASSWDFETFKRWIFWDYIYAVSYVSFFVSLLLWLGKIKKYNVKPFVYIAILAGLFDWIENSLEIWFLSDVDGFSSALFFFHSALATLKWMALPIVIWSIVKIARVKNV